MTRWIDPAWIAAVEAQTRAEQESVLGDVLALYDELSGLFMSFTDSAPPTTIDGQLGALIMLESSLFAHVRSGRAAIADGRAQDVASLSRTVTEIRKKSVLSLADPQFAQRVRNGEEIKPSVLSKQFAQHIAHENWLLPAGYPAGERRMQRTSSAVIHGSGEGLRFNVRSVADGGGISRAPSAKYMRDRGRFGAIALLALAAGAVGRLVPAILKRIGSDEAEWGTRWQSFDAGLARASEPYAIQVVLHERGIGRRIQVGAAGEILEDGRQLGDADVAQLRSLLEQSGTVERRDS